MFADVHIIDRKYFLFILQLWFGGLVSAAIIVLVVAAYYFSNAYLQQYPVERTTTNSSFACDAALRNAKFSTTMQKTSGSSHSTSENKPIFDLLNSQSFTLNIDLIQTAFTCADSLYVQRHTGFQSTLLPISGCETIQNGTTLSLVILLPVHEIRLQLILPGLKTIGAIRLGLSGPAAVVEDGR